MEKQTKRGTLVFLKANVGSKSERIAPYLYAGKDEPLLPLFKEGDNPFENKTLVPFDGAHVEVVGNAERGNDFIVSKIEII